MRLLRLLIDGSGGGGGGRWRLHPLWVLLSLFIVVSKSSHVSALTEADINFCSNSDKWTCIWKEMKVPGSLDFLGNFKNVTSPTVKLGDLNVFYLIKVNTTTGKLYVSATLRWRFKDKTKEDQFLEGFEVYIRSNTDEITAYEVVLVKNVNVTYEPVEIMIPLDNKLHFDKKYQFLVISKTPNAVPTTSKFLTIPSLPEEPSTCTPKEIASTRKLASRWSTAYPEIRLFPLHGFINVSFFGAPPNFCIDQYKIQLWLYDALLMEEIIVSKNDLWLDENKNLRGTVVFDHAEVDRNYTVKVSPVESRESDHLCVCQYDETCGCVTVKSEPFVFALNETQFHNPLASDNGIQLEISTTKRENNEKYFYIWLAGIFGFWTLIFVMLLLWRMAKRVYNERFRKSYLLVNQNSENGEMQRGLIKKSKYNSVLILDVDSYEHSMTNLLARQLESDGIKIRMPQWEKSKIEENKFQWIHQVQYDVDKILVFHNPHGKQVIENQGSGKDILDDVFYILISMIGYDDKRMIHACWENSKESLLKFTETLYVLPRDMSYLFKALDLVPNKLFVSQFKENMAKQEVTPTQSLASSDLTLELANSESTQEVSSLLESTGTDDEERLTDETATASPTEMLSSHHVSPNPKHKAGTSVYDSGYQDDSRLLSIA